jgi:hypothetical protein
MISFRSAARLVSYAIRPDAAVVIEVPMAVDPVLMPPRLGSRAAIALVRDASAEASTISVSWKNC